MGQTNVGEEGFRKKLEDNKSLAQQSLFREKEVDNLQALIYGSSDSASTVASLDTDTNRFDVSSMKLNIYKQ